MQLQPLHLSLSHSSVRFLLGFVRDQAAAEPARDAQAHAQIDAQTVTDSQSSSDAQSASDAQSSCDAQSVWDAQSVADAQPVLWLCAVQPLYLHVDHVARIPLLDETLSSTNMVEVVPLCEVRLAFGRLELSATSYPALLAAALAHWWPQLIAQLHRCLAGLAPFRPLLHVADGLSALLMGPLRPSPWRGLRYGGTRFAGAVVVEGLALTERVLLLSQAVLEQVGQLLGEQPTPSSTAEERPLLKAARATARHAAGAAKSAATGVAAAAAAAEAVTTGTTPKAPPARMER